MSRFDGIGTMKKKVEKLKVFPGIGRQMPKTPAANAEFYQLRLKNKEEREKGILERLNRFVKKDGTEEEAAAAQ